MENASGAGPRAFDSSEWDFCIVGRDAGRVWFGHVGQKTFAMLSFFFALAFAGVGVGIFLENEGLRENVKDATTWLGGLGAFIAASLAVWCGIKLRKGTNRTALLDLENRCFARVGRRDGAPHQAVSCRDLYIHLEEVDPSDGDTDFLGKITIVGPENPDTTKGDRAVNVVINHRLRFDLLFDVVRELQKAAAWKGIIGDEILVNRFRAETGQNSLSELEAFARDRLDAHHHPDDHHLFRPFACDACGVAAFGLTIEHHTGSEEGDFKGVIRGACAECGSEKRLFSFTGAHRERLREETPVCVCRNESFIAAECERIEGDGGVAGFFDEGIIVGKCSRCGRNRALVRTD